MAADDSEVFRIFPVFLVIDVSASMSGGPIAAVNAFLPDLKHEMVANPIVGEIARISLTTFSDGAQTVLKLCDLAYTELPTISIEGGTNFAAAFRETRAAIDTGLRSLPKGTPFFRPVVFFLSDGEHQANEDWHAVLQELRDEGWKLRPEIVTFGFGDVNHDSMQRIATRFAFVAKDADPAMQVREIMNALIGSIRTTSTSMQDPAQADGLHVEAPSAHFTALPALEL